MEPPVDDSGVWERIQQRAQKGRWRSRLRWLLPRGLKERSGVRKEASAPRRTSGFRVAAFACFAVVLVAAVAIGTVEAVKYLGKGTPVVYITDQTTVPSATATTQAVTTATQATTTTTIGRLGELVWKFQTGGQVNSSPAISDGVVYVGSEDTYLYALDVQSGAEKWKFQTGGPIGSSPAISGGVVYFGSEDGYLYAVDIQSGKEKWKFQTGGPIGSSPAVSGGVVYFGGFDHYLYAVDIQTGAEKWKFQTGGIVGSPAVSGGVVCFGSMDTYLYAVDIQSGTEKWKFQTGDAAVGTPAISGGVVYFGALAPPGSQQPAYLYAVDLQSGTERWKFNTEASFGVKIESAPAISDGCGLFQRLGRLCLRGGHPERSAEVEVQDGRRHVLDRALPGRLRRSGLFRQL